MKTIIIIIILGIIFFLILGNLVSITSEKQEEKRLSIFKADTILRKCLKQYAIFPNQDYSDEEIFNKKDMIINISQESEECFNNLSKFEFEQIERDT